MVERRCLRELADLVATALSDSVLRAMEGLAAEESAQFPVNVDGARAGVNVVDGNGRAFRCPIPGIEASCAHDCHIGPPTWERPRPSANLAAAVMWTKYHLSALNPLRCCKYLTGDDINRRFSRTGGGTNVAFFAQRKSVRQIAMPGELALDFC